MRMETDVFDEADCSRLELLSFVLTLFAEDTSTHLEYRLEAFSSSLGVLTEPFHTCLLYLVFDLLPATTKRSDFGFLIEIGGICL